ncbi:MAG: SGNH/GDSL hydrolase family protein [Oscillospiraceae bacterium]|nr:SGNH/GDSL hydrolase family protein [Oscillospiraceae bacterium]
MNPEKYREDISDSLYSCGNNYRLKKAFEKNNINIAFVGGSITKGWSGCRYIADDYTKIFYDYIRRKYENKEIIYSNYSTESANSFMGLSITSKEINDENYPDIVFIEYAVNNECNKEHMISFESIIYKMLSLPSKPAVILLFMINQSLYSCQGYMKRVGEWYGLPMVSVADSLSCMIQEKSFDWQIYSDDWIHPNEWGHKFIGKCLVNCFETVMSKDTDAELTCEKSLYSTEYSRYCPVDISTEKFFAPDYKNESACEFFTNGLEMKRGLHNSVIKFESDFKHLFITYKHDKTERFSDADIYIDGKKAAFLQGMSIYGWGNIVLKHVYSFDVSGRHNVEIRVKDCKKEFFIAEIGVC